MVYQETPLLLKINMTGQCHLACNLLELKLGEQGVLDSLQALEPEVAGRIMRLGFTPGRRFTLMSKGSSCIIATAGARLALDRSLASKISVVRESVVREEETR